MSDARTLLDRFPITVAIVVAWLGLAAVTGPLTADARLLVEYGAASGLEIAAGGVHRLIAYSFLHGGLLHLGFNTMSMMRLGPWTEGAFGSARFAAIYVTGAIGAAALATLENAPQAMLVGGSGAVFALDGALVAHYARQGGTPTGHSALRFARELLFFALGNMLLAALIPYVSNVAHAGGFAFGLLVGWILTPHPRTHRTEWTATTAGCAALGLALCLLAAFPVHRWDWHLFAWERATTEAAREMHRRAFAASRLGDPAAKVGDGDMRAFAEQVDEFRRP